jgi:hypothetical protein
MSKNKRLNYKFLLKLNSKKINKKNKLKIPKTFKHMPAQQFFMGTSIAYDYTINTMYLIKKLPNLKYDINANLLTSSVLSLQN